jgi:putative colanic acid biosynthesis acetyltransferase WcaF
MKPQTEIISSKELELSQIIAARDAASFPMRHKLLRLLWIIIWALLARWTPPQFHAWRRLLLRLFGAQIHSTADVRSGAKIWYPPNLKMEAYSIMASGVNCYNMNKIIIGQASVISQSAYLCGGTHDFSIASRPLITKPILIGNQVWIASEAFIGPGVIIPDGCVIGARAVVTSKLEKWSVYAGNPARLIKERRFEPSR